MEKMTLPNRQFFRLWIATYSDWRPTRWNQTPPRATALELVEEALYCEAEAALFLQGFNTSMLGYEQPIWAVAVPITLRYEGDAQPGMGVEGHAFTGEPFGIADALPADHFQGFDQSPHRSR